MGVPSFLSFKFIIFGQFYKLDVIYECPDGTLSIAPPSHIVKQLLSILEVAPDSCEHPVGILTTEHRDSWYKTRQKLMQGEGCQCSI